MEIVSASSLLVLLVVVVILAIAALRSRALFKLALNFFLKKKRLTALTVGGLIVASAIITGSLAVGDSMKSSVIEEVHANLSGVDEVVHSNGLFNQSIYSYLSSDSTLAGVVDATAPLLMLKVAVNNTAIGRMESNVNLIGYEGSLLDFGDLTTTDGGGYAGPPANGRAAINEHLAKRLGVVVGGTISVVSRNPGFSIESIFSELGGQFSFNVAVDAIVKDTGLGRFNLDSTSGISENVMVDLSYLQGRLGAGGMINTIVVSNVGGPREGVDRSSEAVALLQSSLDGAVGYRDVQFIIEPFSYARIDNRNVFFDQRYLDMVRRASGIEGVSPLISYFVNSISFGTQKVAWSTVAGFDSVADYQFGAFIDNSTKLPTEGQISDDEIILTNYTANRLAAGVGDEVKITYTVYDSTYSPIYRAANFTVAQIVDLVGKADDPNLMPPFPGIRGKSSCGDWEPAWTTRQNMTNEMVAEDLDYWVTYGGAPKAYISLAKAQELWSNDLGNLTTIKAEGSSIPQLAQEIGAELNASIVAGDAGITVTPAKLNGIESAAGTELLTETFISFAFVVIISGIILEASLVAVIIEGRRKEIGLLKTLGITKRKITQVFAFEGFLISAIAAAIGILVGILVAFICISLTNAFWSNIIEGRTVSLYFTPETLETGYVVGFLIALFAFIVFSRRASSSLIAAALREGESVATSRMKSRTRIELKSVALVIWVLFFVSMILMPLAGVVDETQTAILFVSGFAVTALFVSFMVPSANRQSELRFGGLVTVIFTFLLCAYYGGNPNIDPFPLFFVGGFVIVAGAVVVLAGSVRPLALILSRLAGGAGSGRATLRLALLSPSRRVRRTCLSVALFAVVVFTYLGLSVNVQGQQENLGELMARQGAGYDVLAESSLAVRFNLANETERVTNNVLGFPTQTEVVQLLTVGQVGGTCSNLRRNLPPRLLGANATLMAESTLRFQVPAKDRFAWWSDWNAKVWSRLDDVYPDGLIPAVGDYNTVVWILGKNVGDKVQIADERGTQSQLVIVGIFENSIFPGSLFISEGNINHLYPSTTEYKVFLFKTSDPPALVTYLESHMQAFGMDASLVSDLTRDNLAVEWSYMSLFQTLLLLGLFVGIVGIAANSSRAVEERRPEIGTMRAIGFSRTMVLKALLLENLYIASLGTLIGIVAGLLVAFSFFGRGSLLSYTAAVPWLAIVLVVVAVDVAALLATIPPARKAARMPPVEALKREQ